ncbi:MAG: RAMP superfamily CRISPR-associated protein [Snowella sp.]
MYQKAYGIIETLAPLHVGASAGEETGNLNLIFRDQFTQTGIIPGSSIRGRFRADMRSQSNGLKLANIWYGHDSDPDESEVEESTKNEADKIPQTKDHTTEALVKFEYASLLWLPVYSPGQPIVWISSPRLLKRYQQITAQESSVPEPTMDDSTNLLQYPVSLKKDQNSLKKDQKRLFFNLGFLDNLKHNQELKKWIPDELKFTNPENLVVVQDDEMALIHDMALYRQTRTQLNKEYKKVENFFGFEALPESSILVFPIAIKKNILEKEKQKLTNLGQQPKWQPFTEFSSKELYLGGLESIGCGRCQITVAGKYFNVSETTEGV